MWTHALLHYGRPTLEPNSHVDTVAVQTSLPTSVDHTWIWTQMPQPLSPSIDLYLKPHRCIPTFYLALTEMTIPMQWISRFDLESTLTPFPNNWNEENADPILQPFYDLTCRANLLSPLTLYIIIWFEGAEFLILQHLVDMPILTWISNSFWNFDPIYNCLDWGDNVYLSPRFLNSLSSQLCYLWDSTVWPFPRTLAREQLWYYTQVWWDLWFWLDELDTIYLSNDNPIGPNWLPQIWLTIMH